MPELSRAPWSPEQVDSLNEFQRDGFLHPYTCGSNHAKGGPILIATTDGWVCPDESCAYTQDFALTWMVDGRWREARNDYHRFFNGAKDATE